MITFPTNPSVGDIYTSGNQSWQWNGTAWVNANASGPNYVPIGGGVMQGPLALMGVTDGSNAAPGQVGEYAYVQTSTATNLTAQTTVALLTLPLTAGDWDVGAFVAFNVSGGGGRWQAFISTTSGNIGSLGGTGAIAGSTLAFNQRSNGQDTPGGGFDVGTQRFNLTAAANVYLNVQCGAVTSGTPNASGRLYARRMR